MVVVVGVEGGFDGGWRMEAEAEGGESEGGAERGEEGGGGDWERWHNWEGLLGFRDGSGKIEVESGKCLRRNRDSSLLK